MPEGRGLRAAAGVFLTAAAVALALGFLRLEAEADGGDAPTLGIGSPVVDLCIASGAALSETVGRLGPHARGPVFLLALPVIGLALALRRRSRDGRGVDPPPAPGAVSLLLLLPLGLGFLLRFHRLADVPAGYSGHAVVHHHGITIPVRNDILAPLASGDLGAAARIPRLLVENHFGLMSLISALGFEVTGLGFVAARLLSALAGTLTLLFAYRLGLALEGRFAGLALAGLLAAAPWHVSISRYGDLEHVLSPLHALVTLSAYVAALRWGRVRDHVVCGAALGLSFYVYPANIAIPVAVVPHLLGVIAFRRGFLGRDGKKLLLLVAAFAAVSWGAIADQLKSGLLAPSIRTGYEWTGSLPLNDVARHAAGARSALRQLFVEADDAWFGRPGGGVGAPETALILLGLGVVVGSLLDARSRAGAALLLLGIPICMVPGILAPDPSFRRFLPALTIALAVAALGLSRVSAQLGSLGVSLGARAAAIGVLLTGLALVNVHAYHEVVYVDAEDGSRYETDLALFVRATLGRAYIVIVAPSTSEPNDDRWLRIGAGERLATIGGPLERWLRIVPAPDVEAALADRRAIDGKTVYLGGWDFMQEPPEGQLARERILAALPHAHERPVLDRHRQPALRVFRARYRTP